MKGWRTEKLVPMALLMLASAYAGYALWIPAKAALAQHLLERAWQASRQQGGDTTVKPWPWADTWPVAELVVERLGIRQVVLDGDSGAALAFGPGLSRAGKPPGETGVTLISGHRDTHFRFLQHLEPGDEIRLESARGIFEYEIYAARILDVSRQQLNPVTPEDELVLVTCYPFDALHAGGTERYVVFAAGIDAQILPQEQASADFVD